MLASRAMFLNYAIWRCVIEFFSIYLWWSSNDVIILDMDLIKLEIFISIGNVFSAACLRACWVYMCFRSMLWYGIYLWQVEGKCVKELGAWKIILQKWFHNNTCLISVLMLRHCDLHSLPDKVKHVILRYHPFVVDSASWCRNPAG